MTPASIERVFGTSRLKMVTGQYVDVYREAAAPGERRRYTKRFLSTQEGDFSEWTEREWRILARLVGHGAHHVPDVVQYDRGAGGGDALVQTYDAGVTLDHWVTLLQVEREGHQQRHIFQDCAHWWALARHLLLALHEIHALQLVHLDLKADNVCLPLRPAHFDPLAAGEPLYPVFEDIALIDFAFSLISGEALTKPLPIGWQRRFPYQSPRLLQALAAGHNGDLEPTRQLDWRCDMYSLAALLNCLLPGLQEVHDGARERGWTSERRSAAELLLLKIRAAHDRPVERQLPHLDLAADCAAQLAASDMSESLRVGWKLCVGPVVDDHAMAPTAPLTPVTLIEPPTTSGAAVTEIYLPPLGGPPHDRPRSVEPVPQPTAHVESPIDIAPLEPMVERASITPVAVASRQPLPPPPSAHVAKAQPRRAWLLALPALGLAAAGWWLASLPERRPTVEPPPRADRGDGAEVIVSNRAGDGVRPAGEAGPQADETRPAATAPSQPPPPRTPLPPAPAPSPSPAPSTSPPPARSPDASPPALPAPLPAPPSATPSTRPVPPPPGTQVAPGANRAGPAVSDSAAADLMAGDDRYATRARRIVADVVPGVVARASPQVAQVLAAAAQARDSAGDRRAVQQAGSIGNVAFRSNDGVSIPAPDPAQGRQFNAAAQTAFWQRGDAARAFELQWQAFGAHPQDPEIAGNLAFYALKVNPRQVEMARSLAIYALAAATRTSGAARLEDWGNLAVASALSGRSADASSAMLMLLTVSKDVNRSCRSALSSVAAFGPALQSPAEAVLARANERGSAAGAPSCQWPPRWIAGSNGPAATASRR